MISMSFPFDDTRIVPSVHALRKTATLRRMNETKCTERHTHRRQLAGLRIGRNASSVVAKGGNNAACMESAKTVQSTHLDQFMP
jgi:hypothetical protein